MDAIYTELNRYLASAQAPTVKHIGVNYLRYISIFISKMTSEKGELKEVWQSLKQAALKLIANKKRLKDSERLYNSRGARRKDWKVANRRGEWRCCLQDRLYCPYHTCCYDSDLSIDGTKNQVTNSQRYLNGFHNCDWMSLWIFYDTNSTTLLPAAASCRLLLSELIVWLVVIWTK